MHLLAQAADGAATSGAESVLFWIFAALALGSAIAVVTMRNIVHGALMLVLNLLSIAALYLGLQSSFLSIVQVIVYAGAIVVLFLFVIMLLGIDRDDLLFTRTPLRAVAAVVAGVALAGALLVVVGQDSLTAASACGAQAVEATDATTDAVPCAGLDDVASDSVAFVGSRLFTRWTFAFEAASLLLVVATLGALVLGRRRDPALDDEPSPSAPVPRQPDLDEVRDRLDEHAADDDLVAAQLRPSRDATAREVPAEDSDTMERPDTRTPAELDGDDTAPDDGAASGDQTTTEGGR